MNIHVAIVIGDVVANDRTAAIRCNLVNSVLNTGKRSAVDINRREVNRLRNALFALEGIVAVERFARGTCELHQEFEFLSRITVRGNLRDSQISRLERVRDDGQLALFPIGRNARLVERQRAIAVVVHAHAELPFRRVVDHGVIVASLSLIGDNLLCHIRDVLADIRLIVRKGRERHRAIGGVLRGDCLAILVNDRISLLVEQAERELDVLQISRGKRLPQVERHAARRLVGVLDSRHVAVVVDSRRLHGAVAVVGNRDLHPVRARVVRVALLREAARNLLRLSRVFPRDAFRVHGVGRDLFLDIVRIRLAIIGGIVLDQAERHRTVGLARRCTQRVALLVEHLEAELLVCERATRKDLLRLQLDRTCRFVGVRERRLRRLTRTDDTRSPRDARRGVTVGRHLGDGIRALGRQVLDGRRLAALERYATASSNGATTAIACGVRIVARVNLTARLRERQRERERLVNGSRRSVFDILAQRQIAIRVVPVGDQAAFAVRRNVAGHELFLDAVVNLDAILVFVQFLESVGPLTRRVGRHLLRPVELAFAIQVQRDAVRTRACRIVAIVPLLGHRERGLLGRVLVSERVLADAVDLLLADRKRVAGHFVFHKRVDDGHALAVDRREIVVGGSPVARPVVIGRKHLALARILAVGIQMHGDAAGALAVLVVVVGPRLRGLNVEGNQANLDVIVAHELIERLDARRGDHGRSHGHVVVRMGAARKALLGLPGSERGVVPLAFLARGCQIAHTRRDHMHIRHDRVVLFKMEVVALRVLGGVDGDRRDRRFVIRANGGPDGGVAQIHIGAVVGVIKH